MTHFLCSVMTRLKFSQTSAVDFETQCRIVLAELDGQVQAEASKSENGDWNM